MTVIRQYDGGGDVADPDNWPVILIGETGPPGADGADGAPSTVPGPAGPIGAGLAIRGAYFGTATPLPNTPATGDLWILGPPLPTLAPDRLDGSPKQNGDGMAWDGTVWVNTGPSVGPRGPTGATGPPGDPGGPPGPTGPAGATGAAGAGVAAGGTTGQVLTKASGADYATNWQTPTPGVATSRSIATTAPLTGGGDLSTDRTLAITDFTASTRGAVPNPGTSSGRFLKDDGTWDSPASVISGAGGVFPFQLSGTITEPPTGSQIRGNNATFTSSTKLWVMETTTDGLDVAVGLSRIKAGFQVYVQDYDAAGVFAVFNVTADAVDRGAYWEIGVALATSAGTIPAGKIALQSLSSAQAGNLFSTTTSAKGLAPGSSGGGAAVWLNGAAGWTAPTATTVGLGNVDNTSNATERAATATLTNKRVTKRTGTTTSTATPSINTDTVDFYSITALAVNITSVTVTGTPTEGQTLWVAITGTAARTIAWGSSFEASTVALPTTTVTTARLDVGFVWNTVTSKWRCVASA